MKGIVMENQDSTVLQPQPATTPTREHVLMTQRLAFSVRETAQILGISEKSVRRLISRRLLRASNALRHILVPRNEIERFLKETVMQ